MFGPYEEDKTEELVPPLGAGCLRTCNCGSRFNFLVDVGGDSTWRLLFRWILDCTSLGGTKFIS